MTICICKGTELQQTVASTFVTVAQVISLGGPSMKSETFEADTLDNTNAGIPKKTTGRTDGGTLSGEMFLDPALQGHNNLQYLLESPEAEAWKIIFADTGVTEWTFAGAGFGLTPAVALNDGLKASFEIELDGMVTFPIAGSS